MKKIWEKIKEFFQNKTVIIVEIVLLILIAIGLFIGGITAESQKSFIDYAGSLVILIRAIVKAIKDLIIPALKK